jgi:LL-diaminopimelate aminotransferase
MTLPATAERITNLPIYVFAALGERLRAMQRAGIDVIRLDVGSPDMPPPEAVIEALYRAASQPGNHGYSGYRGIPRFREAVARYYARRFGVSLDPETEVLPLLGSKEGIVNLCLAYLDRGDAALIPDIGYPSYAQGTRLAAAEICWMPTAQVNGYAPDFAQISPEAAARSKLLWVNYPNNPTGATVDLDFYARALGFCAQHDILLASDNPYVDVTFDGYVAPSALQVADAKAHTVEFISLSKSHNMAGWRIGAAVGSSHALNQLLNVKSNMDSGHFPAIYEAAAFALDNTEQDWIDARNQVYRQRRDRIIAALPRMGLSAQCPQGSLYVWAESQHIDAGTYVEEALTEAHVSLAPGEAYGPGGTRYLRFSVGISDARLDEAITRLSAWYQQKYA